MHFQYAHIPLHQEIEIDDIPIIHPLNDLEEGGKGYEIEGKHHPSLLLEAKNDKFFDFQNVEDINVVSLIDEYIPLNSSLHVTSFALQIEKRQ